MGTDYPFWIISPPLNTHLPFLESHTDSMHSYILLIAVAIGRALCLNKDSECEASPPFFSELESILTKGHESHLVGYSYEFVRYAASKQNLTTDILETDWTITVQKQVPKVSCELERMFSVKKEVVCESTSLMPIRAAPRMFPTPHRPLSQILLRGQDQWMIWNQTSIYGLLGCVEAWNLTAFDHAAVRADQSPRCPWGAARAALHPNWTMIPSFWRRFSPMSVSSSAASCKDMYIGISHSINGPPTILFHCLNDNPYRIDLPHKVLWGIRDVRGRDFERRISWALRDSILIRIKEVVEILGQTITSNAYQHLLSCLLPSLFPQCMSDGALACEFVDQPTSLDDMNVHKFKSLEDVFELRVYPDIYSTCQYTKSYLSIPLKYKGDMDELYYSLKTDQDRFYFLTKLIKTVDLRIKFCTRRSRYAVSLLSRNATSIYVNCLSTFVPIEKEYIPLFEWDALTHLNVSKIEE